MTDAATPPEEQPQISGNIKTAGAEKKEPATASQSARPIKLPEQPASSGLSPHSIIDERSRPQWVMAVATVGILVASILNVVASCNQGYVMREQLEAMKKANESTKTAANAAVAQADAALVQATAAKDQVAKLIESNRINETSAKQNLRSADSALRLTRQALEVQQRAYVHVQKVEVVPFRIGDLPQAIVYFKNTGATPALNLYAAPASFIHKHKDGTEKAPPYIHEESLACDPVNIWQILPPGVTRSVNTIRISAGWGTKEPDVPPGLLTPESMTQRYWVIDNSWYVVMYLSYFDQFGTCHASIEPFQYDPTSQEFMPSFFGWRQADYQSRKAGNQ